MNTLIPIFISVLVAIWVVAMAILSVQNATLVHLKFLTFQSIDIPVGLLLGISTAVGLIIMAAIQPLWGVSASGSQYQDEDAEFFVDNEDF